MTFKYITNINQLGQFQNDLLLTNYVSLDTETTGLDVFNDTLTLLQTKLNGNIYIFDVVKMGISYVTYICNLIEASSKTVIGHNLDFDLRFVKLNTGVLFTHVHDTMLTEMLIYNGMKSHTKYPSLLELVNKYKGILLNKEIRKNFIGNTEITQDMLIYSAEDVEYLDYIMGEQLKLISASGQSKVLDLEMKVLPVVVSMELNGIKVNVDKWNGVVESTKKTVEGIKNDLINNLVTTSVACNKYTNALELFNLMGMLGKNISVKQQDLLTGITDISYITTYVRDNININSSKQLLNILTNIYNIDVKDTNEKTLNKLSSKYPIIKELITYRGYEKELSSFSSGYLDKICPKTGRIHTSYNQLGAVTGRFSSENPNMQNVKGKDKDEENSEGSKYRPCFEPEKGWSFISADYSQQELRLTAEITQDKNMQEIFKKELDPHRQTASGLFKVKYEDVTKEQRSRGKSLNFAINYGTSEYGLEYNFNIPLEEAKVYIEEYNKFYSGYSAFIEAMKKKIWEVGYSTTILGRKRYFEIPTMFESGFEARKFKDKTLRSLVNHTVQGCLPPDAKILTKDSGWKNIIDFDHDKDLVWTGKTWAKALLINRGKDTRIRLHLSDGRTFDCDTRHKLLINDSVWPRWATMDEIIGKRLVIDTQTQFGLPDNHSVEDWYWYGRMIGGGSISAVAWTLAFGHNEQEVVDQNRFESWLKTKDFKGKTNSECGWNKSLDKNNNVSFYGYTGTGKNFWKSLGLNGNAHTKRISGQVFSLDYDRRKAVFDGYFDADGYIRKARYGNKITSCNRDLLSDTLKLMQTLGLEGKIGKVQTHVVTGSIFYGLQIHNTHRDLVVESIDILEEETMYTLSVLNERHAFSTEGMISKNSGADMTKKALVNVFYNNPFEGKLRLLLQVHDELVLECEDSIVEEACEFVKEQMLEAERYFIKSIESKVDVGHSKLWEH